MALNPGIELLEVELSLGRPGVEQDPGITAPSQVGEGGFELRQPEVISPARVFGHSFPVAGPTDGKQMVLQPLWPGRIGHDTRHIRINFSGAFCNIDMDADGLRREM